MVNRSYKCNACKRVYEEKVSIKDDVRTHCKKCGGEVQTVYGSVDHLYFKNQFIGLAKEKTQHGYN